jgi:hypothetical protein
VRFAYWIPKAIDTHSEFVTLIAFPLQQWLQEGASLLRYTNIPLAVLTLLTPHIAYRSGEQQFRYSHPHEFCARHILVTNVLLLLHSVRHNIQSIYSALLKYWIFYGN